MNIYYQILLIAMLTGCAYTKAQPVYFSKSYHKETNMFDLGTGSVEYSGSYYTIGQSSSNVTSRYLLLKTDLNGDTLFTKFISEVNRWNYVGGNLIKTLDNNFAFCGTESLDTINGSIDSCRGMLLKIDQSGDTIWTKKMKFSTNKQNLMYRCFQTTDKGFVLCGVTANGGINYAWGVKVDSLGNSQWQYTYGGNGNNEFFDVEQTFDGGYVFAGNSGGQDLYVVKTNSLGVLQWQKSLGTPNQDGRISYIHQLHDSSYIITGLVDTSAAFNYQGKGYIAKLRKNGSLIWERTYTSQNADDLIGFGGTKAMEIKYDEYIILGSKHLQSNPNIPNLWLVRIDSSGTLIWERTYNYYHPNINTTYGYNIIQTSDNGFLITGSVGSLNAPGGQELWLMKLDSLGCDTIDCSLSIRRETAFIEGLRVYPNPAGSIAMVYIREKLGTQCIIMVYNPYGQICYSSQTEEGKTTIDIANFADGIYIIRSIDEYGNSSNCKLIVSH
jgi:hypothetical protein